MENRKNITEELLAISPTVAQLDARNPYEVPAGYFSELPEQVLLRIRQQATGTVPGFPQPTATPYAVPQGYFENLPAAILQRVKALEEAETLSPLLSSIGKQIPFSTPAGYFENLPAALLQRVKAQQAAGPQEELETLSPLLSSIGKQMPFSTPAGYFEELSSQTVAGAQAIAVVNETLENLSPVMQSLKHKNCFEVPAGYFEQLPEQLLQKARTQQPSRVVRMKPVRNVMQYAVAAVVSGLIMIGAWFFFSNTNGASTDPHELAEIEQISDEVLESYLEDINIPLAESMLIAANEEIDMEDMREMLADISDEELQRYVSQYQAKDIFTN